MIGSSSTLPLSEYLKSSSGLLKDESDIIKITKDGQPFFYFTHYSSLKKILCEFLGTAGLGAQAASKEAIKEPKRVKIEVATELEGRTLTQAEQTLLKVRERFHFFQNMSDAEVLGVTNDIGMLRLGKNEVLFRQGSDGDQVYFVVRGVVSIRLAKSATENIEVAKLHTGAVFGEMSPVTKEKRSATVVCAEDNTTLLTFRLINTIEDEKAIAYAKMYQNFTFILADKIVNQNKLLVGGQK